MASEDPRAGGERNAAWLDDGFLRRLVTRAHFELFRLGALGAAEALDLAQDVALELYRLDEAGKLEWRSREDLLRGLGATIVRRRAIDLVRRPSLRRQRAAPHASERLVGTAAALDRFAAVASSTSTRLRRIDAREKVRRILDFIAAREAGDARCACDYELLVLRHVEEREYAEIAERRGRGEGAEAVRSRLRRLESEIRAAFPSSPPRER